jgi:acyl carrier protein
METVLDELDEWDSLSMMATMAFLDKNFGVKLKIVDLKALGTIGDIAAKANIQ